MNANILRFPTWRRTTLRRMNAAIAVPEWSLEGLAKCIRREVCLESNCYRIMSLSAYRYKKTGFFLDFTAAID